jgi:hypothetical protein
LHFNKSLIFYQQQKYTQTPRDQKKLLRGENKQLRDTIKEKNELIVGIREVRKNKEEALKQKY